jgi:glutaminyl-peptide cyclotransferase
MRLLKYLLPVVVICALSVFSSCGKKDDKPGAVDSLAISYQVVNTLPHNTESFIEGLVIHNNKILESTGQEQSWIAEVNPASGQHDKKVVLDNKYFGEGITVLNNKIYQLTWTSKVGFIYDASTYKKLGEFTFETQGWGLTQDGHNLIMSDGSEKINFLDTTTLKPVRSIIVTEGANKVKGINELEFINGHLYANVWQTDIIVKIEPASGKVVGKIDISPLAAQARSLHERAEVSNGIAYDANSKSLLITGKHWPKAYLIKLK